MRSVHAAFKTFYTIFAAHCQTSLVMSCKEIRQPQEGPVYIPAEVMRRNALGALSTLFGGIAQGPELL